MSRVVASIFGLRCSFVVAVAGGLLSASAASAQLRMVTWNISNYTGGRTSDIQTVVYGVVPTGLAMAGQSMNPDIIMSEEIVDNAAQDAFLLALNTAPGGPGDWDAVPFTPSPDTATSMFYRTSRVQFIGVSLAVPGGNPSGAPRNVLRYDVRPVGYNADTATVACFVLHMKAGSLASDQSRRAVEATALRTATTVLLNQHPTWNFLMCGDLNIQASNQTAYQTLTAGAVAGRVYDPINTPGSWNNVSVFRFVHTQDPATSDGMDDRFDQFLVSDTLVNGQGMDYIGAYPTAYSTTTWNDPNHSQRAWGNDGTSFNNLLKVTGNTMVGPTIAQAIINAATAAGGHIPVYIDVKVPARAGSSTLNIDFGTVSQGSTATQNFTISNTGNTALWTAAGIDNLDYTLVAPIGFTVTGGPFSDAAGGGGNAHSVGMLTSTLGFKSGTLVVLSDDPEQPQLTITVSGTVVAAPPCPADLNGDHVVGTADLTFLLGQFGTSVTPGTGADINGDGVVGTADLTALLGAFGSSC